MAIQKCLMGTKNFPDQKWKIFRNVKEIKGLRGGILK